MSSIRRTLKDLREASGKSQSQIARELGVDQKTISLYENLKIQPSLKRAVELSLALGCSLDEIATAFGFIDSEAISQN